MRIFFENFSTTARALWPADVKDRKSEARRLFALLNSNEQSWNNDLNDKKSEVCFNVQAPKSPVDLACRTPRNNAARHRVKHDLAAADYTIRKVNLELLVSLRTHTCVRSAF